LMLQKCVFMDEPVITYTLEKRKIMYFMIEKRVGGMILS